MRYQTGSREPPVPIMLSFGPSFGASSNARVYTYGGRMMPFERANWSPRSVLPVVSPGVAGSAPASTSLHLKRSLRSRRLRLREHDCVCKKYATRDSDDAQHAVPRNCSGTRQARPTSALPTEREFSAQLSRRLRREAIWDTPTRRVRPGCCAPGGLIRSCLSARPSVRVQSKIPPSQAE
jgi:hypothetical protein